jgi:hypothetical protein
MLDWFLHHPQGRAYSHLHPEANLWIRLFHPKQREEFIVCWTTLLLKLFLSEVDCWQESGGLAASSCNTEGRAATPWK